MTWQYLIGMSKGIGQHSWWSKSSKAKLYNGHIWFLSPFVACLDDFSYFYSLRILDWWKVSYGSFTHFPRSKNLLFSFLRNTLNILPLCFYGDILIYLKVFLKPWRLWHTERLWDILETSACTSSQEQDNQSKVNLKDQQGLSRRLSSDHITSIFLLYTQVSTWHI